MKLYEQGRHEMLNETNRDEVVGDLVVWLKNVGA
jgi:alpha-beta hydrolase superfamily lysophospholipase